MIKINEKEMRRDINDLEKELEDLSIKVNTNNTRFKEIEKAIVTRLAKPKKKKPVKKARK